MESVNQNLPADSCWEHLAPILDEAMLRLRDKEHDVAAGISRTRTCGKWARRWGGGTRGAEAGGAGAG